MPLKDSYTLPAAADMHVHLRAGAMCALVTLTIRPAGVDTVFVMPNLSPRPVVSVEEALAYKALLQGLDPQTNFLMSLYLHESVTPEVIKQAKKAGIAGVKAYPRGATTNSEWGVVSFVPFYPVLEAMEEVGMVLNIHGEMPAGEGRDVTVMNAEMKFLPVLEELHARFPSLKMVLEHCTSREGVEAVRRCGGNVVGTVTAHHLGLVVDGWAADVNNYCKPAAKTPEDRRALLKAVVEGGAKFFLGTDSAPHDVTAKKCQGNHAAGVFTQPYALGYVLDALEEGIKRGDIREEQVNEEVLANFLSEAGRKFYGLETATRKIVLKRGAETVVKSLKGEGVEVVPFRAGERTWSVEWV